MIRISGLRPRHKKAFGRTHCPNFALAWFNSAHELDDEIRLHKRRSQARQGSSDLCLTRGKSVTSEANASRHMCAIARQLSTAKPRIETIVPSVKTSQPKNQNPGKEKHQPRNCCRKKKERTSSEQPGPASLTLVQITLPTSRKKKHEGISRSSHKEVKFIASIPPQKKKERKNTNSCGHVRESRPLRTRPEKKKTQTTKKNIKKQEATEREHLFYLSHFYFRLSAKRAPRNDR